MEEEGLQLTNNKIKRSVGIDLGTTYCCVAMMQHGKVVIIANDQDKRTTPSYVAFTNTECLIGDLAKKQIAWNLDNTDNTVYDAKRLIGRDFDDPDVQSDMKYWTFKVVSDNDAGKPKYLINFKGEKKTFFPEEISYMILKRLKDTAEKFLDGAKVTDAVITVPAYFNDSQRQATKHAAESAGFTVLRLLNEPTAAAIAYGLEKKIEGKHNVLIFDLGGGTFDVSIVTLGEGGVFEVKSTAGNTHLGGRDFDNCMVKYLLEKFTRESEIDVNVDKQATKKATRRLQDACEIAKHTLSTSHQATIKIKPLYKGVDFSTTISRAKFEELCNDLFHVTLKEVEKAISDAKMDKSDIHDIVLVGGSTRIPKVQKILQEFFDGRTLNKSINPDEAVAYGAAVQAAKLSGDKSVTNFDLQDVNSLSLGIRIKDDAMAVIIGRNSKLPIKCTQNFTTVVDNQKFIKIDIYEGEHMNASKNHHLDTFDIDIDPEPQGVPLIVVTFEIGKNGILEVSAKDDATGNEKMIEISDDMGRLCVSEIVKMIQKAEHF